MSAAKIPPMSVVKIAGTLVGKSGAPGGFRGTYYGKLFSIKKGN
jgi:hypothetical protein